MDSLFWKNTSGPDNSTLHGKNSAPHFKFRSRAVDNGTEDADRHTIIMGSELSGVIYFEFDSGFGTLRECVFAPRNDDRAKFVSNDGHLQREKCLSRHHESELYSKRCF
jgi:hypothetical protein